MHVHVFHRLALTFLALALVGCGDDKGKAGTTSTSGGAGGTARAPAPAAPGTGSSSSCGAGDSYGGGGTATPTPATPATPPASPSAAVKVVEIRNMQFVPATLTIKAGDSVKWVNRDRAPHTATRDSGDPRFDTGNLSKDQESKAVTFSAESGAEGFDYVCTIHDGMRGKVIVTK